MVHSKMTAWGNILMPKAVRGILQKTYSCVLGVLFQLSALLCVAPTQIYSKYLEVCGCYVT